MRLLFVSALIMLSLVFVGAASAGIPSASTSTLVAEGENTPACNPNVAVVCPASDMGWVKITVVVRNIYGDPLPGKTVTINASPIAPDIFCFCPGEDPQLGVTDGAGTVIFYYHDFGGCGNLEWYATCDGVVLGPSNTIYIASPDNNADCQVTLVDFGYFALCYLTTDPCCDYNCDGIVDLIDFGTFSLHYQHACP
jgi:hypothetical protein